jgi:hypothetical protein
MNTTHSSATITGIAILERPRRPDGASTGNSWIFDGHVYIGPSDSDELFGHICHFNVDRLDLNKEVAAHTTALKVANITPDVKTHSKEMDAKEYQFVADAAFVSLSLHRAAIFL